MNSLKEYYNDSVFIIRKITSYISDWEKPMKTKQKRLLAANKFLKGSAGYHSLINPQMKLCLTLKIISVIIMAMQDQ